MNILIVLTSHDTLGDTGRKTGFWLEEFAAPYYAFLDAGATLTLASPQGGQPPLDPKSDDPDAQTDDTRRFRQDAEAQRRLASTRRLAEVQAADYDAVFYPGGHGPLWDLAEDPKSVALIETMLAAGKPVAAVCHAPGVLRHAKTADGKPLVQGRQVTGFSNTEEAAVRRLATAHRLRWPLDHRAESGIVGRRGAGAAGTPAGLNARQGMVTGVHVPGRGVLSERYVLVSELILSDTGARFRCNRARQDRCLQMSPQARLPRRPQDPVKRRCSPRCRPATPPPAAIATASSR